ncbi:mCpol domain-containing protein [Funiculus sociatus GB2-A5]|uniref:MCpol domain-containing protein n=1 Tax=Funiculus sociatus GB2-A5 TaxID=2933946 RepID=A0ABV0JRG6_9CYAN|nr:MULTISPECIES: mCpol domain-containing protein [unclassified Trichocoleus]MBD1905391.1 mCpol domain-containing protein [Trichocoleus sp. FACHB-832]MBD2061889.1 mCpol domain-containing protein [Trichocoleus sp. FACHB-6]
MSQDLLVCIGDGDDIGNVIDFYLLTNDLDNASNFSFQVKSSIERIAKDAQVDMAANLIYVAGDDICFVVSKKNHVLDKLKFYSDLFFQLTGKTMSFGIGNTPVVASICLRKAKVSGKGRIVGSGV